MQQVTDSPSATEVPDGWLVLVYRVPSEPSSNRVSVWRDLKRIGALYLQQCVCVVPARPDLRAEFTAVRERLTKLGGSSTLFEAPSMPAEDEATLVSGFRDLVAKQYAEIVEECESKFVKEIEFEHFRKNYSFAEAEEIEHDLEKIRRWFARVIERDWFAAPGRSEVEGWIERCAELLEGFYAACHAQASDETEGPDAADRSAAPLRLAGMPLRPVKRRKGDGPQDSGPRGSGPRVRRVSG